MGGGGRLGGHSSGTAWVASGSREMQEASCGRSSACRPEVDGHAMDAAGRGHGPSVRGRGGQSSRVAARLPRLVRALFAVCAVSAPMAARGQFMSSPAAKSVRTLVGCSPLVAMTPTMLTGSNASRVWSRVDENRGLPRNGELVCGGQLRLVTGTGLQVCGSRFVSVRMTPEKAQAGKNFTAQLLWEYAVDATKQPKLQPGRPGDGDIAQNATGTVTFVVAAPQPEFVAIKDEPGSYVFSVGCPGSVTLSAYDANAPVDLAVSGCISAAYAVDIVPIAAGSYPPTPTGLPQGVALAEGGFGGVAKMVRVASSTGSTQVELQWTPERGQERSTPYRICFKAEDVHGLAQRTKCITVKVQKCVYCAREGDTIASIATQFDTDWLQLYTVNPLVTNPDSLPVGTRINTGVFYQVRKGDYLELLYDRFFVSEQQLLQLNPDVEKGQKLVEAEELCVSPPVCNVECKHGLDCTPVQA